MWQDRPEIEGGVGWWRQIETALERVEFLVSVMTPAALASEVTAREWRAARQRGVCVFPVQGPGFDFADPRLPRWMAKAHFYALDTQWETFLAHLQRGCQTTRVPFMAPDLPIGFVQRPKQFESMPASPGERPSFKDAEDAATSLAERLESKNCLIVTFRLLKAGALALEGQHRSYSS